MTTEEVTYRVRVRVAHGDGEDRLVSMSEFSGSSEGLRKQWVGGITDYIWGSQGSNSPRAIRPWDFILDPNGSVESLPLSVTEGESSGVYPAHYRIPPASIESLTQHEQINRQERFAFGTLLYSIGSGKKPFEWLESEKVQQCYSNAEFPDDVKTLPPELFVPILSFWSLEFANIINPPRSTLERFTTGASSYIKAHPYLFAFQVTGALLSTAAVFTLPLLGAVGFGAHGVVAGSAAAGWQASIGIVEAGSLFAWCQSAAMGGAAVSGIMAAGAAGGGAAAFATAAAAGQSESLDVDELMKKFKEVYRRGHFGEFQGQNSTKLIKK